MHSASSRSRRTLASIALGAGLMLLACNLGSTPASPTSAPAATSAPVSSASDTPAPASTAAPAGTTAPTAAGPAATNAPAVPFSLLGKSVNRDATQAALGPGLAAGAVVSGDPASLWVAWAENTNGGKRQIFVSELIEDVLQPRGDTLNLDPGQDADNPTIGFAGANRTVPWTTWSEPSPAFAGQPQIFASRFISGTWQPAGQDRGSKQPSLNHDTKKPATNPFIFPGTGDPAQPPVPWIVWLEDSGVSNFAQVFVAKGVKDAAAIGGFHWELVGANDASKEPSLNVDLKRDSAHPSGVFAGSNSTVPWVTWSEFAAGRAGRIFTSKGVADANTPGGFKWVNVPPCTPDEKACTLNINPSAEAKDGAMAAGSLAAGADPVPWIAWAEVGQNSKYQIVVSRLNPDTKNGFLQVGGSLNANQNHDAKLPRISFVGNVPYVAWLEDDGNGHFVTQLRHLASDPQTANWVLDSSSGGLRSALASNQTELFSASSSSALYLAWTEGDPTKEASQIWAGQLKP